MNVNILKMPAVKGDGMRGLAVFISDIRNCKSKEAELKRINKELANIRSKFKGNLFQLAYFKSFFSIFKANLFFNIFFVVLMLHFFKILFFKLFKLLILCHLGDRTLDGYQKKKYVCKLLFIFLLGHDIDFGHMEAVNLLSSNKYTEKQIV